MTNVSGPDFRLWLILGSVVLFGCQETDDTADVKLVIDLKGVQDESRIQVYEPSIRGKETETADQAGSNRLELSDGEYFVSLIDGDSVAMSARQAPRKVVLLELASQLGFALRLSEEPRGLIDVERFEGLAVEAIRLLLDGMAYSVDYVDQSESALPAIGSVNVGYLAKSYPGLKAEQLLPISSGKDGDSDTGRLGFPYSNEKPITIDQSVSKIFEYGSVEEMLELVNEIELTSAGVRILADQLRHNPDPRVRIEVLDALSGSEAFAAKWMVLNALKDTDDGVVVAALEVLDVWQDPTTVPYVEAVLQRSNNPEIVTLAESIIDYNSDLETVSVISQMPEEREAGFKSSQRRAHQSYQQHRQRRDRSQSNAGQVNRSSIHR